VNAGVSAISTQGLGRDYGGVRALDALTLDVPPCAMVGLLGPNGAGKTTAMLLLATLLAPTRGAARIFGHDTVRERRAVRRRLGLVFQETSVDGLLTVEENLRFAARLAGLSERMVAAAVAAAIERIGLGPHARTPARRLSGGWRRLTDIARATLHRPELLILDEPTVGLDPEHRERIWSILAAERRERGTTILFSTHYLAEAEPADRVALLSRGRVVASDAPAALRAMVGAEVAEIEGPGAERLARALRGLGIAPTVLRTELGYRVGISGEREAVLELATTAPGIARLTLRPATLEDVYFARTRGTAEAGDAGDTAGPVPEA
jgi:ABC-2 type transport system ATP-binding protein